MACEQVPRTCNCKGGIKFKRTCVGVEGGDCCDGAAAGVAGAGGGLRAQAARLAGEGAQQPLAGRADGSGNQQLAGRNKHQARLQLCAHHAVPAPSTPAAHAACIYAFSAHIFLLPLPAHLEDCCSEAYMLCLPNTILLNEIESPMEGSFNPFRRGF